MKITINNQPIQVKEGTTIMEACNSVGIIVPSLCYLKDVSSNASCGICVVEVKGAKSLLRSCVTQITEGMEITTNNQRIQEARKVNVELLMANHPVDCLICDRNQNCELQQLTFDLGIHQKRFVRTRKETGVLDNSSLSLVRNPDKCILCGRCVAVCSEMQTVKAIDFSGRGQKSHIATFLDLGLGMVACTNCGQCALVCPTGAITEKSAVNEVWEALHNPEKVVLVQTAPAIRVGIGETMGMPYGSLVTGKMVAGLRRLGFSKIFDTNFAADLTIIEEGHELIHRIKNKGILPMITSCSPGWIKFIEHFFPASLKHLSTCKSPQQMFGAIAKTYYAEKTGIDPRNIVVVSVMPCTAKKYEARRPEMDGAFQYWKNKLNLTDSAHFFDVDYALTTRELGRMFKESGVDFVNLPEEHFDNPLGTSTGAAAVFGVTGGVMEAALRTAYEVFTGLTLESINFETVRGMEGIKEAEIDLNGTKIKVAVAHTLKNARILLEQIEKGTSPYTF
ncbi:MAG TPA: [FeFe] hydrogenase, group A, partial [Paludibacter sp.]